jgi:hypothetical protein
MAAGWQTHTKSSTTVSRRPLQFRGNSLRICIWPCPGTRVKSRGREAREGLIRHYRTRNLNIIRFLLPVYRKIGHNKHNINSINLPVCGNIWLSLPKLCPIKEVPHWKISKSFHIYMCWSENSQYQDNRKIYVSQTYYLLSKYKNKFYFITFIWMIESCFKNIWIYDFKILIYFPMKRTLS